MKWLRNSGKTARFAGTAALAAALLAGASMPAAAAPGSVKGWTASGVSQTDSVRIAQRKDDKSDSNTVPLRTITNSIERRYGGRLIDARHDSRSRTYFILWETSDFRILQLTYDSRTGQQK